jgi:hypothetical protein
VKRVSIVAGLISLMCAAGQVSAALAQTSTPTADSTTLPAGTKIELAVTAPVWARSAKPGDTLYSQVDFPVLAGKSIAIPAGTYVQGQIFSITRPTRFKGHAEIQVLFSTIIFANGYAVQLPALPSAATTFAPIGASGSSAITTPAPVVMQLTVSVSSANDLLLDNGSQFDVSLVSPLSLDSHQVAAAIAASRPADLGQFKSATLCRPTSGTPGTPGSPDTVIPGSPGTPSITIPGGPGMPDTVIPGTPATPDTVIPGSPGTPGFPGSSCPGSPIVVSSEPLIASPSSSAAISKHP